MCGSGSQSRCLLNKRRNAKGKVGQQERFCGSESQKHPFHGILFPALALPHSTSPTAIASLYVNRARAKCKSRQSECYAVPIMRLSPHASLFHPALILYLFPSHHLQLEIATTVTRTQPSREAQATTALQSRAPVLSSANNYAAANKHTHPSPSRSAPARHTTAQTPGRRRCSRSCWMATRTAGRVLCYGTLPGRSLRTVAQRNSPKTYARRPVNL
jgi:hypothetical protein